VFDQATTIEAVIGDTTVPCPGPASVTPTQVTVTQTQTGATSLTGLATQNPSSTIITPTDVIGTPAIPTSTYTYQTITPTPVVTSVTNASNETYMSPSTILVGDTAPFAPDDPVYASIMGFDVTQSKLPLVIGAGLLGVAVIYLMTKKK